MDLLLRKNDLETSSLKQFNFSFGISGYILFSCLFFILIKTVGGNPDLCASASCRNKKPQKNRYIIPLVASVTGLIVLLLALTLFWQFKRGKHKEPSELLS